MTEKMHDKENWISAYWRPAMAWSYLVITVWDFIIAPAVTMALSKNLGALQQWDPLTLKESGFYHIAMAGILGVSAWTRGVALVNKSKIPPKESETE